MPPEQDVASETIAAITARLAARHDGLAILRAVTDACGPLLSSDATGVLVADPRGGVEVAAASDERSRFIEFLQAQIDEGPGMECTDRNVLVSAVDLEADLERWPRFAPAAREVGFRSVYSLPLRLMDRAVGNLNVFYNTRTDLPPARLRLAQALADLAVLGLTQERDERRVERLAEQTLTTLNDRIRVGHALGVIAATLDVTPDAARDLLWSHSAATGRSLRDLAQAVASGTLPPRQLGDHSEGAVRD